MIWYVGFWIAGTMTRLIQAYAPTNLIAGFIRTRRGHKWGLPISAVLVPAYALTFKYVADIAIATDNPWLAVLAMLLFWNTGKFISLGFVGVVLLVRTRFGSRNGRRA